MVKECNHSTCSYSEKCLRNAPEAPKAAPKKKQAAKKSSKKGKS
jgi:hypothetical protein